MAESRERKITKGKMIQSFTHQICPKHLNVASLFFGYKGEHDTTTVKSNGEKINYRVLFQRHGQGSEINRAWVWWSVKASQRRNASQVGFGWTQKWETNLQAGGKSLCPSTEA